MNLRPNTMVEDAHLSRRMLLCCGEDEPEFVKTIEAVIGSAPTLRHRFRCYSFYKLPEIAFIWTGIGTGCLEPLLCEILSTPVIEALVLVGTAGSTGRSRMELGTAYYIEKAKVSCAGVSPRDHWLRPRWTNSFTGLPTATIVSTDYYYGFSPRHGWPSAPLRDADTRLEEAVKHDINETDLVDMETGQFYHLCRVLRGNALEYLAIKGPANTLAAPEEQTSYSQTVLYKSIAAARRLLSDENLPLA